MFSKAALLSLMLPTYAAVHESIPALPFGWSLSTVKVLDDAHLSLQVALQYQDIDSLESRLASISTPGSAEYGKYLDRDDLYAVFAPSSGAVDKVESWLRQHGVSNIQQDSGFVSFDTTVGVANKLLDTKFDLYTDGKTNKLRTLAYSVPDDLSDVIDLVSPTTYFGGVKAHKAIPKIQPSETEKAPMKARQFNPSCESTVIIPVTKKNNETVTVITPTCLKELYNIGDYQADPSSGSSIAFGSFLNYSAIHADLAQFEKMWDLPPQDFTVLAETNGGVDDQHAPMGDRYEPNLDSQSIFSLIDGLPVGEYITGGSPPFIPDLLSPTQASNENEPYLPYYQYLLSQPNSKLPYVISNSYGDHENTVPERYAKRVCNMIGMMGMRGRTIVESTGDEGVGAVCRANTGAKDPEFTPWFPASCPYVTSVGGTQFVDPEIAWNQSSGGFSFYFDQPWYQKTAVETYLSDYLPAAVKEYYTSNKYVDLAGRGMPDISAHAMWPNYPTIVKGTVQPIGGTSASAPVVASIIALLNDARFRAREPAMGFINPWLYSHAGPAGALADVTLGGSKGCHGVDLQSGEHIKGAGIIRWASWNATVGWDPVTGLGLPDFTKLKALALADKW